jgi:uncharacterized low-complexity protein
MKRIRILGMALVAVLAMSAVAVAIASAAAPEFSPATNSGTSKSATATFTEEGEVFSIKCTSNTGTSTITSAKAGTFEESFKNCKAASIETCTTTGQASGTIVSKGTFALGFIKGTEVGLKFSPEPTEFKCSTNTVKVTGCAAAPITPINTKTKTFTVELKGKTKQEPAEFEGAACTLKSEKNGGTAKSGAQEQKEEITETEEGEIT